MDRGSIKRTKPDLFVALGSRSATPYCFDKPWYPYMHVDGIPDRIGVSIPPCTTGIERPALPPANIDAADRLPACVTTRQGERPGPLYFDSSSVALGEVRPLTKDYCAGRTEEGVFVFGRRCPHEGGDLAAGYIEGGVVRCPKHDLAIDVRTGESPCRSLPAVATLAVGIRRHGARGGNSTGYRVGGQVRYVIR
jgi:nitrite reductase/ring-hydroxylating ferredoxin subunit